MTTTEKALNAAMMKMVGNTKAAFAAYDATNAASVARLLWAQRCQRLVSAKRLEVARRELAAR